MLLGHFRRLDHQTCQLLEHTRSRCRHASQMKLYKYSFEMIQSVIQISIECYVAAVLMQWNRPSDYACLPHFKTIVFFVNATSRFIDAGSGSVLLYVGQRGTSDSFCLFCGQLRQTMIQQNTCTRWLFMQCWVCLRTF